MKKINKKNNLLFIIWFLLLLPGLFIATFFLTPYVRNEFLPNLVISRSEILMVAWVVVFFISIVIQPIILKLKKERNKAPHFANILMVYFLAVMISWGIERFTITTYYGEFKKWYVVDIVSGLVPAILVILINVLNWSLIFPKEKKTTKREKSHIKEIKGTSILKNEVDEEEITKSSPVKVESDKKKLLMERAELLRRLQNLRKKYDKEINNTKEK